MSTRLCIWRKKNGDIVERYLVGFEDHFVGEVNAYGWTLICIKHLYGKKWRLKDEYERLCDREYKWTKVKIKLKYEANKWLKMIIQCLCFFIIFKITEVVMRIGM